jgi:hypothetical protein
VSDLLSRVVDVTIEELERRQRTSDYFNDPALWAKYMLNFDLWSKQREIAQDVVDHKNVAVKAGHGVGKSLLVSVLICWWIDTRYPNAFVASTAPSTAQIGGIVWREIRKHYSLIKKRYKEGLIDHELPGYITADNQWKTEGGNILGFGRKPPDNKEDDAFQGLHDAYVLAVGDEAVGLSSDMIDALGNITSNKNSRRILIANPTNPSSAFAKIFKEDNGAWRLHTLSVFDSPNFTAERHSMSADALSKLTDQSYVEDKKKEYGEDSARYKARVLGEFAFDQGQTLFTDEDYAKAIDTELQPSTETTGWLGVDVARFGPDETVVYHYHDGVVRFVDKWGKSPTTETANRIHRLATDMAVEQVRIDSGGVGGGIFDGVNALSGGAYLVIGMVGGAASPDRQRWHNARAYWYDTTRENMRNGKIDLAAHDDHAERLHDELLSIEYKFSPTGGLLIESKDDMRKRGVKSPDFSDAMVYACADLTDELSADPKPGDKLVATAEELVGNNVDFLAFGW